jgi:hypothetical protein
MAKSNYPTSLDTSKELPPVRDNITEIGSEILNGLRDAILQIERTLGVNPHGVAGSTVAARINMALDSNGNIRKEALTKANVLSGPITNADVSNVAAIAEEKLRLKFPTQVLQDQIAIVSAELQAIVDQVADLNATISTHVHPDATNRHKAVAITVESANITSSSTAFTSIDASDNLQDILESIVNGHINFSGSPSATNNSHSADQVYFDTENVEDVIFTDNVQGAIEDLANLESVGLRNNTLNLASNGRIRSGSVTDGFADEGLGEIILSAASVSFVREGSRTRFSFESPQTPLATVSLFDYLNLSSSDTEEDNRSYQIAELVMSGSDVSAVVAFGVPLGESITGMTATISKNPYTAYNPNGLNGTVRPRADKTNTPDVFIAHPDAATIISKMILPSKIVEGTNTFDITVDGGSAVTIETYDSNVSNQTIESVVNKINEQVVDQNLSFMAYKLRQGDCYELAISHVLPNIDGDVKARTLKIEAGSSDDGTSVLGFTDSLGVEYHGTTGNSYHINGLILDTFGSIIPFTGAQVSITTGANTISLLNSETFTQYGVRSGDIVVITDAENSDDDGTYRISLVSSDTITIDDADLEFADVLNSESLIQIIRCTAAVTELDFTEAVSIDGSILFDVLVDERQDVHYHKRLEVDGALSSNGFIAVVSDVSKNFIVADDSATINIGTDGYAYLTDPTLRNGASIYVGQSGTYKLLASDGLSYITLSVTSTGLPTVAQSINLYGFEESHTSNLRICRGTFATSLGRVLGEYSGVGVPSLLDKRRSGTVDETIVGESLLEKYIEGPRNELRSHGIVRGLGVSGLSLVDSGETDGSGNPIYYHEFDISAGVAYVNGIRYEISGYTDFRVNTGNDFYIAVDAYGCIVAGDQITNPDSYTDGYVNLVSPFSEQELAYLAFVDSDTTTLTDLRFFIDRLDLKGGQITVSKTQNFGHFTDIKSAVDYASRFTEIHPNQGTPVIWIDQGDYEVDETIVVDFDVKISGAGPDTIIRRSTSFAAGTEPSSGYVDFGNAVFLVGKTSESGSERLIRGVTFSDFTYESNEENLNAVSCVISITQPLVKTGDSANRHNVFRVQNINFIGPSTISYGSGADDELIGEYAIALGQTNESTFTPVGSITMGNLIVTGCRFDRMGLEYGAIVFSESGSSTFSDVIISSCIGSNLSPTVGATNFEIIEKPTTPTLDKIIEIGNAT